jgi:predicted O-methyltransferase YrrM
MNEYSYDIEHFSVISKYRIEKYGFNRFWGHLPPTPEVKAIFDAVSEVVTPKTILEFGSCLGFSSTYFLQTFPEATVHSFDIRKQTVSDNNGTRSPSGVDCVRLRYGDRFVFTQELTTTAPRYYSENQFELAFVDADHSYKGAALDIETCMKLKIPYIMVDNCNLPDVANACDYFDMDLIFSMQYHNTKEYDANLGESNHYDDKTILPETIRLYKVLYGND